MTARAIIASVDAGSPAACAGFQAGDAITFVDGQPVRDILDWQWLTTEDVVDISYVGRDGDEGCVSVERDWAESWGITFEGVLFDGVRTCRNACTFCFMRQLPEGLRSSLYVRDDDFRLSFLQGNFVTLTNLTDEDVRRIITQRISPLRVSLHAVDGAVRTALMGRHAPTGLANLEALLDAGIEVDAQIVLVPGMNDGTVLDETLAWAYKRAGIRSVGIVPLGYTAHQDAFYESFDDPREASSVIEQIRPFQERAMAERGIAWAFASDELYLDAYGDAVLDHLPDAAFYGDFPLFEDGIGIVRASVDGFARAVSTGAAHQAADALAKARISAHLVCGFSMKPYLPQLIEASPLAKRLVPLFVRNDFFGGNVDVTGLLAGADMAQAIRNAGEEDALFLLPAVAFNADGVTMDDMTAEDIGALSGRPVQVVPSNPLDCIDHLIKIGEEKRTWRCPSLQ